MTEEQLKEKAKAHDNACKAAQKFLLHAKTLQESCERLKASKDVRLYYLLLSLFNFVTVFRFFFRFLAQLILIY